MDPIAATGAGRVRGQIEQGVSVFRGIPYAAPPVGDLRWRPPAPAASWTGVRDALKPGAACGQAVIERSESLSSMMRIDEPRSEDCLYLNVSTPSTEGALPVMVWIHGGAFSMGSGAQRIYRPHDLCRRDVVVVSINYRLGPFGFAPLDTVTSGAIPSTGNEGLLDQVAALEWVRQNIAGFGGDPENITIFGESSGGCSVACLMSMPLAKGLFHKAIVQSGGDYRYNYSTAEAVGWFTEPMLERLGTRDPASLIRASAEELLKAFPSVQEAMANDMANFRFAGQVIDGNILPSMAEVALAAGSAAGVPLLAGATRDEMATLAGWLGDLTHDGLVKMLASRLGSAASAERMIETYRCAREARGARSDVGSLLSAILGHRGEIVPAARLLDAQRAHAPVYSYIFDWMAPTGDGANGAFHGVDVPFTFGSHTQIPDGSFGRGPAADALSAAMMDSWTTFARTGNPSSPGLGDWPTYDSQRRPTMMIGPNVHVAEDPFSAERRAWDEIATLSPAMQSVF